MQINDLTTPALLLNLDILTHNILRMSDKARHLGVALRPHIKTHKCVEIANIQRDHGAEGLTVSTLDEAVAFAEAGFADITYAVTLEPGKIDRALALASRIDLGVTVDDLAVANALAKAAMERSRTIAVWLKVDTGNRRTGVDPESEGALELAATLMQAEPAITFAGLLTHAGHAYKARSADEIRVIIENEQEVLKKFILRMGHDGKTSFQVSVGSTPTLAHTESLSGVDEIRPGNYVFYDRTQVLLGSCSVTDCALTVLTSVVSRQPGGDHAVVDAGALALSHDPGPTHLEAAPNFGVVMAGDSDENEYPTLYIKSLSQEHGQLWDQDAGAVADLQPGDRLEILPNHSCLVAPLFDHYNIVRGGEIIDQWPILRTR